MLKGANNTKKTMALFISFVKADFFLDRMDDKLIFPYIINFQFGKIYRFIFL